MIKASNFIAKFTFLLMIAVYCPIAQSAVGLSGLNEVEKTCTQQTTPFSAQAPEPCQHGSPIHCQVHCGHSHYAGISKTELRPADFRYFGRTEKESSPTLRFISPKPRPPNA